MKNKTRLGYLKGIEGAVSTSRHVCSTSPSGRIDGNLTALDKICDTMVLLHGPAGCGYHHRMVARLPHLNYDLRCTNMDEKDVVIGSGEKLVDTIEHIIQNDHPAMLAVLPSSCSEVLGVDIVDTLKCFAGDPRCKVFPISPEFFSHRDKRSHDIDFAQEVTDAIKRGSTTGWGDRERSDCGMDEVTISFVEHAMEPQPLEPYTINLDSRLWGDTEILESMTTLFSSAGIKLRVLDNSRDIIRAPSAALNIAGNPCWAKRMQKKFGTDFISLDMVPDYNSIDGTRHFYQSIADRLGKSDEMRAVLSRDYKDNKERHEKLKHSFTGKRYAMCTWSGGVSTAIKSQQDYGIFPEFILTDLSKEYLRQRGVSEETILHFRRNVEKTLDEAGFTGVLVNESVQEDVKNYLEQVDILIGGDWLIRNLSEQGLVPPHIKTQPQLGTYAPLGMVARLRIMEEQVSLLQQNVGGKGKLYERLRKYEKAHPECTNSADMAFRGHRVLWFGRKEQEAA